LVMVVSLDKILDLLCFVRPWYVILIKKLV
jgi:hypothetical protein